MSKKYEFTGKTKKYFGRTLHQIVCVTAFASVSVGDVGGWIETERNLDQSGNAWVYGNAEVLTKKAVNIISNHYSVTITDTHMTIGCQNHPKQFWKDANHETIKEINGEKSAKTFMEFKPFLMKLAEIED